MAHPMVYHPKFYVFTKKQKKEKTLGDQALKDRAMAAMFFLSNASPGSSGRVEKQESGIQNRKRTGNGAGTRIFLICLLLILF